MEEPIPVERETLEALISERERYKAALEWIAASNPAALRAVELTDGSDA